MPWTFIALLLFPLAGFSEANLDCSGDQRIRIDKILISGNEKTRSKTIEQEFGVTLGSDVCEGSLQEGLSRLRRTGLFSSVDMEIAAPSAPEPGSVKISLVERWTTIPVLKISSGGGVSQYTLGVYDPNLFGRYLEAGFQYENLAGANSGVLWFKNPRIWGQRQGIDLQYWNTRRARIKYDQEIDDPEIKRGFLHEREKFYADFFREFASDKTVRFSLDYNKDEFSTRALPSAVLKKMGPNPELPSATELLIAKIGIELGRIEGDGQSLRGHLFIASLGYASPLKSTATAFTQGELSFVYFHPLSANLLFGQRILAGTTTTKVLQYWYYLGGLDRIRGFSDNRFSGRYFGLSNSEARYRIYETPSMLLQGAGFLDLASMGERGSDLTSLQAASAGAGIRVILPKFYRFVVRVDYAKPLVKKDDMNWSLGVQQFF